MITAEELVFSLNDKEENKNFKLAIVVDLFDNDTAKIKFDGEDIASEKQYPYLSSYVPKRDDRVLLGAMGGTYIILGKVNYDDSPNTETEIDRYLFELKKVIIQKGLKVTLGTETDTLTVTNGATMIGDVGVDGSVTAIEISSTGAINGASVNVVGELKGNSLDVNSVAKSLTTPGITCTGPFYANNNMQHRGQYLGFYNATPTTRITVSNLQGTPTLSSLQNKINDLLNALNSYGLINN